MTSVVSPFHFSTLVWDWPIAIYLFLLGISAGLVTLAILLRRYYPQAGSSQSALLRTTLWLAPSTIILGLLILIFHLARPWTFWKLMFHYNFTSVMSMGVLLFQVYMVVLVLWLAPIFANELKVLQQRWLPQWGWIPAAANGLTRYHNALETLLLVLSVLLGAYTGFLLSALKSYPLLNNPVLPVLFLFSGLSSGAAVALLMALYVWRSDVHSDELHFIHRVETPIVWLEVFLLAALFVGLGFGDKEKMHALTLIFNGSFWSWWFWLGVVGIGLIIPLLLKRWALSRSGTLLVCIASLCGVLFLRFFILYAGQMVVA